MLGIIKRDLILLFSNTRQRIIMLFLVPFFIFTIETETMDSLYFMIIVAFTNILVMTPFSYDIAYKSSTMMNSLPIKRKEMVISKYLSVFVYVFITIVYVGVYMWIINKTNLMNVDYFNLSMIKKAIPYIMLTTSIMLPANFRLEPRLAQIINIIIYMGIIFIGVSIEQESIGTDVSRFIKFFQNKNFILVASVIYILSMILSIQLYEHRDL